MDKFFRCPNCQSYSLSKSDPNLKEKIISLFIPAFVYECSNCSYRYVDKDIIAIRSRFRKVVFFVILPLLMFSIIYFLNSFSDDQVKIEKKPVLKKEEKKIIIPPDEKIKIVDKEPSLKEGKTEIDVSDNEVEKIEKKLEIENNIIKPEQKEKIIKKSDIKYIICGNSKKYGVNWKKVKNGIEIVRITSGGVFNKGGIKKGDVLIAVNGVGIIDGSKLNQERNKLFSREINFVELTILRNEKELNFRLIKINDTKVFDGSVQKVRSSHPLKKERRFRWKFLKNTIVISRNEGQKVFIAGDFSGMENWAVDDTLLINGKSYPGIKGGSGARARLIDDDRKFPPLDITDLIPAGKKITLNIELANHGKLFGNTDIFVVVK